MSSLRRVAAIAAASFLEAARQRVFLLLLLCALLAIGGARALGGIAFEEEFKFLKDFGLGAMAVFGAVFAVVGAAQAVQAEIEQRTLALVLARPVGRGEFLWGKFLGLAAVLLASLALMGAALAAVLFLRSRELAALPGTDPDAAREILRQGCDPALLQAWLLVAGKVCLTAGVALAVAACATSVFYTVAVTFLIYLAGHLEGVAREAWLGGGGATLAQKLFLGAVAVLLPDFGAFGLVDDLAAGGTAPWKEIASLLGYTAVYLVVILTAAQLLFQRREW
ncbi:MAG: ABC transporter permease subunit [Verrucomicrobium sp.]|nr:ABC transporter permease subunit [Verrucomicrobium sp.]